MLSRLDWRQALALALAAAAVAVVLAEVYTRVGRASGLAPWVAAAAVNSCVSAGLIAWLRRDLFKWSPGCRAAAPAPAAARPTPRHRAAAWAAPVLVLAGAALLAAVSRAVIPGGGGRSGMALPPLAWIFWIPPIEELVFRGGVGRLYRRLAPGWLWPAWFSALTFALVHANPTVENLMHGRIGLPLGPFFLGLACEALFAAAGNLGPPMFLHAACNATAAVFVLIDPRWLDWLGFLYG